MFMLSAQVGEAFHYMAAYERFQGWGGTFLQKLGAYSIRRGLGDRASVVKTIELLMQPRCRLVIFPEGGCSFQNDTVMPFRTGAIQVGCQALSKLAKQGEDADLYVVPISIKYRYTGDMNRVVHRTLQVLERALHLPVVADGRRDRFYARLRTVAEKVMIGVETDYGLHDGAIATLDWNRRIERIRSHILTACEQKLDITPPPHQPLRERVYRIQSVLESRAEAMIARDDFWTYESIHKAAARLLNFNAIYDGYVAASPTPERYLDTLVRLEREQFNIGEPVPKGHRNAVVKIGEPLNLKDYLSRYQCDRTTTVDQLANTLQQQMQSALDELNQILQ